MGSMPYSLVSEDLDLTQMVMDIQKHFFQQHYQKIIPWETSGSMPYTWVSKALDLTQVVMYIRKQLN